MTPRMVDNCFREFGTILRVVRSHWGDHFVVIMIGSYFKKEKSVDTKRTFGLREKKAHVNSKRCLDYLVVNRSSRS